MKVFVLFLIASLQPLFSQGGTMKIVQIAKNYTSTYLGIEPFDLLEVHEDGTFIKSHYSQEYGNLTHQIVSGSIDKTKVNEIFSKISLKDAQKISSGGKNGGSILLQGFGADPTLLLKNENFQSASYGNIEKILEDKVFSIEPKKGAPNKIQWSTQTIVGEGAQSNGTLDSFGNLSMSFGGGTGAGGTETTNITVIIDPKAAKNIFEKLEGYLSKNVSINDPKKIQMGPGFQNGETNFVVSGFSKSFKEFNVPSKHNNELEKILGPYQNYQNPIEVLPVVTKILFSAMLKENQILDGDLFVNGTSSLRQGTNPQDLHEKKMKFSSEFFYAIFQEVQKIVSKNLKSGAGKNASSGLTMMILHPYSLKRGATDARVFLNPSQNHEQFEMVKKMFDRELK